MDNSPQKQNTSKPNQQHSADNLRGNKSPIENKEILQIGYYPIRGKAQVPRLIMEFLGIPYIDRLFQLQEWDQFKKQECKDWDFADLPYLIDQQPSSLPEKQEPVIITEAFPICEYLIEKRGRTELLGKTVEDKAIVQMYLWTIDTMGSIININCKKKSQEITLEQFKQYEWKNNVLPRLLKYQSFIKGQPVGKDYWFLGYLTIIDFSIYELVRYINMLFPGFEQHLPKMNKIKDNIYQLHEINEYENSDRCIKQMDPSILLKRLKNKSK